VESNGSTVGSNCGFEVELKHGPLELYLRVELLDVARVNSHRSSTALLVTLASLSILNSSDLILTEAVIEIRRPHVVNGNLNHGKILVNQVRKNVRRIILKR